MVNLADISGADATVPLSATNLTARWVQMAAIGTGTIRFGGSNVSASVGIPIVCSASAAGYFFLPYDSALQCYSLAGLYAYIPTGVTLSVGYEPFN